MDEPTTEARTRRGWLKLAGAGAVGAVGATVAMAAPALAAGSTFVPITPFRALDTRAGLPIQVGSTVDTDVSRNLVGVTKIAVPFSAVAFNITVTKTHLSGWLSLFPANVAWPGTSTVNWSSSGLDVANGGIVAVGSTVNTGPFSVAIKCGGKAGAQTHVLLDITGYFA